MIADECKQLRDQLKEVAKAEERERIVKQLDDRSEELTQLRDIVLAATESLTVLAKRTSIVGTVDGAKAHERVVRLREALAVDPHSITKGHELTNMKKAFEKFAQQVTEATAATWDQYKPKAKPNIDANQLTQAEQQEAFRTVAAQLKASAKYADQLSRTAPATEEDFAALETTWGYIRELIDSLPTVASHPKVREFLKAANSSIGAPLELLTDEVWQWLQENRTADRYRIFSA